MPRHRLVIRIPDLVEAAAEGPWAMAALIVIVVLVLYFGKSTFLPDHSTVRPVAPSIQRVSLTSIPLFPILSGTADPVVPSTSVKPSGQDRVAFAD